MAELHPGSGASHTCSPAGHLACPSDRKRALCKAGRYSDKEGPGSPEDGHPLSAAPVRVRAQHSQPREKVGSTAGCGVMNSPWRSVEPKGHTLLLLPQPESPDCPLRT
jgi:hypothetical protein